MDIREGYQVAFASPADMPDFSVVCVGGIVATHFFEEVLDTVQSECHLQSLLWRNEGWNRAYKLMTSMTK